MKPPTISDYDIYLFGEGKCLRLYDHFGAHIAVRDGKAGTRFVVWAPGTRRVSVVGNFNKWNAARHPMTRREGGVHELFIEGVGAGELYRYEILTQDGDSIVHSDPVAFASECPPKSASIIYELEGYKWNDDAWIAARPGLAKVTDSPARAPLSIYEVHLGSWRRNKSGKFLTYRELAEVLPEYVASMGFTHVELMPVAEHPFYGSWGYQQTGYYSATARYGTPHDFMALVDAFHAKNIGVILDWVPAHFPTDGWGLARFDGTGLYEHLDPRRGFHQDWKTYIFNYNRNEVVNFLLANALFWIDKFHIDGLRVDAVSSMLYLDYSRKQGEWLPNQYGGRENLEAIEFLRNVNLTIAAEFPGTLMVAEESTTFAGITRPAQIGGLGFRYKWNLGWMHDWLDFFAKDPLVRKFHTGMITFSMWYAYSEKYILNLGHDEVVHMKGSLLNKMPGAAEQKAANLRALFAMMYAHPGGKLIFMGSELAPWSEWNHDGALEWHLLDSPMHAGVCRLVRDLNHIYKENAPLHALDEHPDGFEWIDFQDLDQTTFSWLRYGPGRRDAIVVIANLTPMERSTYRIGVPRPGFYKELLNTDAADYEGTGIGNLGGVTATEGAQHNHNYYIEITLPPLGVIYFRVPDEVAPAAGKVKKKAAAKPAKPAKVGKLLKTAQSAKTAKPAPAKIVKKSRPGTKKK